MNAVVLTDPRIETDVWGLLVWAYRDQRAGRLGLGRSVSSKLRWMNYLADLDGDGPRTIHRDAAAVHRVVCGILDEMMAGLVMHHAGLGQQPEPATETPRPLPMPNRGRGGAAHAVRGQWIEVDPIRLTAAERTRLKDTDGHGEIERSAVPGGALRWRYRIDLRPRRRCKRARVVHGADGKPRATNVGFAVGDHVWSPWCPLDYVPSPEFMEQVNAIHALWHDALDQLEAALLLVPFRSHSLIRRGEKVAQVSKWLTRYVSELIDDA